PAPAALKAVTAEVAARGGSGTVGAFEPAEPALAGRALAVPVPGRRGGAPVAWLIVIGEAEPLGEFERLIARQAAMVVGLELMRERAVRETERRLAGDLLAEALGGRLDAEELAGRLRPFGIGGRAAVLVFAAEDPVALEASLEAALADAGVPALVAITGAAGRPLLCAVIDAGTRDPVEVARGAKAALARAPARSGRLRAAASRALAVGSLRRAFHEARCALEATMSGNGEVPDVASHRHLGAFKLLLSLQDDEALRTYSDGLLEPIERLEGEYGGELLRSLEAFIENNGNWERAARQLYCHRHTLRYRIRRIEELTGRDMSKATDRIELWLALRAREVLSQAGAGEGSGISDADYEAQGARIVPTAEDAWGEPDLVLKVKEPQAGEVGLLQEGKILFTYLHLAPAPELARGLCETGATMLERPLGGRGILLGGVPGVAPANVMIIGGGAVGMNAAFIAIGMEADVFVYDTN